MRVYQKKINLNIVLLVIKDTLIVIVEKFLKIN